MALLVAVTDFPYVALSVETRTEGGEAGASADLITIFNAGEVGIRVGVGMRIW